MRSALPLSTTIVHNPDIIAADMDGEKVMMSVEKGQYYGLTGIGPFLWDLLAEPLSIEALCRRVLEEYEIDEAACLADVSAYIADLLEKGVLRLADRKPAR